MDNVQKFDVGSRLCAIILGVTVGSISPAIAATHGPDLSKVAKKVDVAVIHSAYWATGLQSGSQSTQKIVATSQTIASSDFFLGFGQRFDSKQTALSSDDHQLIWDNLDYLLS